MKIQPDGWGCHHDHFCLDMYIEDMNLIWGPPLAKFWENFQTLAKIAIIVGNMKFCLFASFYSLQKTVDIKNITNPS